MYFRLSPGRSGQSSLFPLPFMPLPEPSPGRLNPPPLLGEHCFPALAEETAGQFVGPHHISSLAAGPRRTTRSAYNYAAVEMMVIRLDAGALASCRARLHVGTSRSECAQMLRRNV